VPYLGAAKSAPADVEGTVTVIGLPEEWHDGWGGSITFEANEGAAASLHWMALRV
jgi:hypothetical protein